MKKFLLENGRPDKPVACPRCNSLNTKFCYFNNYNVKQPRHFCRECQRYWTAGGSLRNVPVGAGRRKHKISSSRSYGSTSTTSDVDESMYPSSLKPYPSLQLVACSPDGTAHEIQSFKELGHDDVMSMYASERPRLPQTVQKLALDATLDSKFSLGLNSSTLSSTNYDAHAAGKLGFLQMTQKRARDLTLDTKFSKVKHVYAPGNASFTSTHEDAHDGSHDDAHGNAQREMHNCAHDDVLSCKDENHDADDKGAHVCNGHDLPPSPHGTTQDLPVSCHMAEHDDSTCCSSVTVALTSSSSEGVSETNGSSPTTHTQPSVTKPTGLENPPATWGPLTWPWLWPFFLNRGNCAPGMPHVDPSLALGLGAVASSVPQVDSALTSGITAESASNVSHVDPAYTSAVGGSFLHWPYVWNPLAWGSPWNASWNGASMIGVGNQQFQDPAKEKQGSLCVPKTLRMDRPDEAAYRSILNTLGVATSPHSPAGYFNAFQPKADVFQPKATTPQAPVEHLELHEHSSPHVNPAAQARSVAFQEGS